MEVPFSRSRSRYRPIFACATVILLVTAPAWNSQAPWDDLRDAIAAGDLPKVQRLVKGNPYLALVADSDGDRPLHFAADNGQTEIAEFLLANGAPVNEKDRKGRTPLHFAASDGSREVSAWLLNYNADVNARDNTGLTPLHYAARFGRLEVAELLLAWKAEVNAKSNNGNTPLHLALADGHQNLADLLLSSGADPNAKNNNGRTPTAVSRKGSESLEQSPDADAKDNSGKPPLHIAQQPPARLPAESGDVAILKFGGICHDDRRGDWRCRGYSPILVRVDGKYRKDLGLKEWPSKIPLTPTKHTLTMAFYYQEVTYGSVKQVTTTTSNDIDVSFSAVSGHTYTLNTILFLNGGRSPLIGGWSPLILDVSDNKKISVPVEVKKVN